MTPKYLEAGMIVSIETRHSYFSLPYLPDADIAPSNSLDQLSVQITA